MRCLTRPGERERCNSERCELVGLTTLVLAQVKAEVSLALFITLSLHVSKPQPCTPILARPWPSNQVASEVNGRASLFLPSFEVALLLFGLSQSTSAAMSSERPFLSSLESKKPSR